MNIVVGQISEADGLSVHHVYPEGQPGLQGEVRLIGRTELSLRATREGNKVELVGSVRATAAFECDRCLSAISVPVEQTFDLIYVPPLGAKEERELGLDDLSTGFYQGDVIDADDLVREQIELALPMARICGPDCLGLCPECGANLNERKCDCKVDQADSRWAALRELKTKTN